MKVTPVPGRTVRDPATGRELTEPTEVPDNDPFWIRRLADGDVAEDVAKPANKAKGAEQ